MCSENGRELGGKDLASPRNQSLRTVFLSFQDRVKVRERIQSRQTFEKTGKRDYVSMRLFQK